MITLKLPNTPAIRAVLRQLAVHGIEDNAEVYEDEHSSNYDPEMAEAYRTFDETVTEALAVD